MIGREYGTWGNKRHIAHRCGDNRGNPYPGPVGVRILNSDELLVFDKYKYLHVQDVLGAVKCHYYPLSSKSKVEKEMEYYVMSRGLDAKDSDKAASSPNSKLPEAPESKLGRDEAADEKQLVKDTKLGSGELNSVVVNGIVAESKDGEMESKLQINDGEVRGNENSSENNLQSPLVTPQKRIVDDDWQAQYLAKDTNQQFQGKYSTESYYFDIQPVAFDYLQAMDLLAILDERCLIKIFKYSTKQEISSFGSMGMDIGTLNTPSAISLFNIGKQVIIAVGESGATQRVQLFNLQGELLAHIGSKGPMLGQFRDITSISIYQPPLKASTRELMEDNEVEEEDLFTLDYVPPWYKGKKDLDQLEDYLLDEQLLSNFVVGQRPNDPSLYDIVYISPAKTISRLSLKYDNGKSSSSSQVGFYITNLLLFTDDNKIVFPSLFDLIKSQKSLLKIKKDIRDYVLLAVNDRKNSRVQICKYYYTKSLFFTPSLEVVAYIGGLKNACCDLRDPIVVAYSKQGELAICDNGRNVIVIISTQYNVIKTIKLPFVSMQQLHETTKARKKNALTEKEIESSKKPCDIQFSKHGNLVIGYRSGGIYVFESNRISSVGALDMIEFESLTTIICDYLTYDDITRLRNCCRFLHNFTRDLRLSFKIFPPGRRMMFNKVLSLFLSWARVGVHGVDRLDHLLDKLSDKYHHKICRQYLIHCQCVLHERGQCKDSHLDIDYDRFDINATDGYLTYDDFEYFLSELFGPKFMWKFEVFVKELFYCYCVEKKIFVRRDRMSRNNETIREQNLENVPVLTYGPYLEVMATLEEEYSGYKPLVEHKLFSGKGRGRFVPKVPTNFDSLENKLPYFDPTEQYESKGILVPPTKYLQGKRMLTKPGFGNAERKIDNPVKEHIETFNRHVDRASNLINKLFS